MKANGATGMRPLHQLMDLRGRLALVTGGAGHVGRTAGETFAELGANLVLLDRDEAAVRWAAEDLIERFGVDVQPLVCDLECDEVAARTVAEAGARAGRLDVLVNAAAFVGTSELPGWASPFEEQSVTTWSRALQVNLTAPFAIVQAATPLLRAASAGGVVINVSSIYGSLGPDPRLYEGLGMGNPAAYAASKGGLEQLTRWLATTLAPAIRVNAVAPGGIERGQAAEFQRRYREHAPLRRMATEEDLKGAFAFLGTDLSLYVTGHVLMVDGGWQAW